MIDSLLLHVRPAVLRVLIAALFMLSASGLYLYGFKGVFSQRGQLREAVASLADKPDPARIQQALDAVREQAQARARDLSQAMPARDMSQLNTWLMAGLQDSASEHHVHLLRVVPGTVTTAQGFTQLPFQVEASGDYEALYRWLRAIEQRFDELPVASLHIEAGLSSGQRVLRMTLVSHLPADEKTT